MCAVASACVLSLPSGGVETPGMTPDNPRRFTPDIGVALTDIDRQVQKVAVRNHAPSDLNELALAIHKLIGVIKKLHGDL
jgi:hypothetical protein